jgi:hypothetical protein
MACSGVSTSPERYDDALREKRQFLNPRRLAGAVLKRLADGPQHLLIADDASGNLGGQGFGKDFAHDAGRGAGFLRHP